MDFMDYMVAHSDCFVWESGAWGLEFFPGFMFA